MWFNEPHLYLDFLSRGTTICSAPAFTPGRQGRLREEVEKSFSWGLCDCCELSAVAFPQVLGKIVFFP